MTLIDLCGKLVDLYMDHQLVRILMFGLGLVNLVSVC